MLYIYKILIESVSTEIKMRRKKSYWKRDWKKNKIIWAEITSIDFVAYLLFFFSSRLPLNTFWNLRVEEIKGVWTSLGVEQFCYFVRILIKLFRLNITVAKDMI